MPWEVRSQGEKWVVVRADTGKVVSHHATKEKAKAAMRARYANSSEYGGKHRRG